jgi:hypothetical protein
MSENLPRLWVRHCCGLFLAWLAYYEAVFPPVKSSGTVLPFRRRA